MSEKIDWIYELRPNILRFLDKLRHPDIPGYYSYSLTGDIFDPLKVRWGLGNTVFAAKSYYMLDAIEDIENKIELATFIKSFQKDSGEICDPLIEKLSRSKRYLYSLYSFDFNNMFNRQVRRAETRQAFAALRSLGYKPEIPYKVLPYSKPDIRKYIESLNWREPWGAGSHVSHLVFFLNNNRIFFGLHDEDADELIDYAFEVTNRYRQDDGSWYVPTKQLPLNFKVNAAMKMMTAYEAAGRSNILSPEKLIDLCFSSVNEGDACNNLNIICVLYSCSRKTDYMKERIRDYCINKLHVYRKHYWDEVGGFSFFERTANDVYYSARISRGLSEPDIHGTSLFLWGIVMISKMLNLDEDINLRVPIT